MNTNKVKKILSYVSLATLAVCVVLLLISLFSKEIRLAGLYLKIVATFATICIGSAISVNSLNLIINKKSKIAFISLLLIVVASIMFLILFWVSNTFNTFTKFAIILAIISISVNLVTKNVTMFGKNLLVLQILTYLIFTFFDIVTMVFLFLPDAVSAIYLLYIASIILSLAGIIALSVLSKKYDDDLDKPSNEPMVTITKAEYEALKAKIKELENNK